MKIRILSLSCLLLALTSCATYTDHPQDPYEGFNRKVFAFNEAVDKNLYLPLAKAYRTLTPWPVRQATGNFFDNLREIPNAANNLLQGHPARTGQSLWRLVINSTFGLAGTIDLATKLGIDAHYQDFGLTLARWGIKQSSYFVIPFLGPSTLRDAIGIPIDSVMTVYPYIDPIAVSYGLVSLNFVQLRAELLETEEKFSAAELDKYILHRDVFLQRRDQLINPNRDLDAETMTLLEVSLHYLSDPVKHLFI